MITAMILVFIIVLLIGGPIFLSLGGAALAPYLVNSSFTASGDFMTRLMVGGVNSLVMLAIPMFVLAGIIMGVGGISERIFNVFALIVGRKPAGIPCAVILTSILYGAICGAGAPAAAAVGSMAIPIMTKLGYDRRFSAGLVAAGGGIGLIIPPSLGYVLYGSLTGTSVGTIFTAGFLPGIVIGIMLMLYAVLYCRRHGVDQAKLEQNYAELKEDLENTSLKLVTIEELQQLCEKLTGVPKPIETTDRVACIVEYRDGTVIDVIHEIKK